MNAQGAEVGASHEPGRSKSAPTSESSDGLVGSGLPGSVPPIMVLILESEAELSEQGGLGTPRLPRGTSFLLGGAPRSSGPCCPTSAPQGSQDKGAATNVSCVTEEVSTAQVPVVGAGEVCL